MFSSIDKIIFTLQYLLSLFVRCDFVALERVSHGVRLTANEMELAIKEYGSMIVMPPSKVYEDLDIIEIEGASPKSWSVRFDFWTEKEMPSDLTLELTLISSKEDLLKVEIDNIHVL